MPAENESLTFEPNDTGGHETGVLPSVLSETWPTLTDACLSLADASAACFFMTDLSGDIVDATPAWRRLNERFGGRSTCAIPGLVPLLHRTKATGQGVLRPLSLEIDGETRHYWVRTITLLNSNRVMIGIAGAFQDWTAQLGRMNAALIDQSRFRDFARATSDWFWETDSQLRLTAVSDRVTALFGRLASDYIGQRLDTVGECALNLSGDRPIDRALRDQTPFRNQLFRVTAEDGQAIQFHLSGVPLFDSHGAFRGFRGAGMDVTRLYAIEEDARAARQRLESALSELQMKNSALDVASAQAQSALHAKNEFLAAMSHELRTPLNAIIGFAEAMDLRLFGDLSGAYAGYARDILSAGRHLLGLINDVLDVSVIETGDVSLSLDVVPVVRLIEQARSLIMLRASDKALDVVIPPIPDDLAVRADERRALQIFVNLLTNAVKFTPAGGKVGVLATPAGTQDGLVRITVWDDGPGIDASDHEKVFEKFQQLGTELYQSKPDGTGLGLHISRELARLMGGDIHLETRDAPGAYFTVLLPAA